MVAQQSSFLRLFFLALVYQNARIVIAFVSLVSTLISAATRVQFLLHFSLIYAPDLAMRLSLAARSLQTSTTSLLSFFSQLKKRCASKK